MSLAARRVPYGVIEGDTASNEAMPTGVEREHGAMTTCYLVAETPSLT